MVTISLTKDEVRMVLNAINNVPEYTSKWDNLFNKISIQTTGYNIKGMVK